MKENQHYQHKKHVDSAEEWKQRTLMAAANRRKFGKLMNVLLWVVALIVVGACVFAYFLDGKI